MQLGVLGCMAERLKTRLVEETKVVDVVCGPDAYRDLPRMLAATPSGHAGVNVLLSLDETYADVVPVSWRGEGWTILDQCLGYARTLPTMLLRCCD